MPISVPRAHGHVFKLLVFSQIKGPQPNDIQYKTMKKAANPHISDTAITKYFKWISRLINYRLVILINCFSTIKDNIQLLATSSFFYSRCEAISSLAKRWNIRSCKYIRLLILIFSYTFIHQS